MFLPLAAGLSFAMMSFAAQAQDSASDEAMRPAEAQQSGDQPTASENAPAWRHQPWHSDHENVVFNFGGDATLAAGAAADAVVAIFGSAQSAGDVTEAVVSLFGDTRVVGPTGRSAVAVFGDTYVNSSVGENAVAVFGDLELGPQARINGDAVAVRGRVIRDPAAVVQGESREIPFGGHFGRAEWLQAWIDHCLLYARPLAFERELGWAWGIALGFLGLYIAIALLFSAGVERCVETIQTRPGQTVITSLLAVLLTPVLFVLLLASIVGIFLVPFVGMVWFTAGLFGKAVILAALGRRVTRLTGIAPLSHIAVAVLVGGLIVLGLYAVPVLGLIAYKLLGILGLGAVIYTLLLMLRQRGVAQPGAPAATAEPAAPASGSPIAAATEAAATAAQAAEPAAAAAPAAPAAAALGATALPRAGFWIRMAALFIDALLIGIITAALDSAGGKLLLLLAIYGALMWKLRGTTVGGIILGLKVVRRDAQPITWETAVVRALSCFLSLLPAGLGFVWIAFDQEKQAWHDKIAGTLVVRAPRGEVLA